MKILRLLLSKRISKLEHVIHIGITLGTSGWWGIVYLLRALIYGNLKRAENSNSENGSSRVVSRVSTGKIGTYTKRVFATEEEADEDEWGEYSEEYSFEAVGESYARKELLAIIKSHDAIKSGELAVEVVMQKETNNDFDEFAVALFVEGKKVGYVSSDISSDVTDYLEHSGFDGMKVNGIIGWDTSNPNPPIGVRLDFNF